MMKGKWSDPHNMARFFDLVDLVKAQGGDELSEQDKRFLQDFFASLQPDIQALVKAIGDFMVQVAEQLGKALIRIAESSSGAQKDGRTRAYGAPAVAFQAPPIPTLLPTDSLIPTGVPFAVPGVNVHNEGAAARVTRQLDQMEQEHRMGIARRRRFE